MDADCGTSIEPRAPTPFTAEQIREGCPIGRTITMLVEAEGSDPYLRVNRFVECDEDGATVEQFRVTPDGEPTTPVEAGRATWVDLQAHASFPAGQTLITPDTITSELGVLECQRYTVTDGANVHTFWFAAAAPGMPMKYCTAVDGAVIARTTVISDTTVPPGSAPGR